MDPGKTWDSWVRDKELYYSWHRKWQHVGSPCHIFRGLGDTCIALGYVAGERDTEFREPKSFIMARAHYKPELAPQRYIIFITEQGTNLLFSLEGGPVSIFPCCLLYKESWKDSLEWKQSVFLLARWAETWEFHISLSLIGEMYVRDGFFQTRSVFVSASYRALASYLISWFTVSLIIWSI